MKVNDDLPTKIKPLQLLGSGQGLSNHGQFVVQKRTTIDPHLQIE